MIPIHKKCARNQACNYCPVNLTSIFSKFMESIIKDYLISHLLANNLPSDHQFGFITGRSCTTQLLYVLDYFTKHLDKGELIDVIYVTRFAKIDYLRASTEIHFLPVHERYIHALFRNTNHQTIDCQVCFYRRLFIDAVKPRGCISWS